jgi:hypothetical protein
MNIWLNEQGIAMSIDQFNALVRLLPDITAALEQKGETIPRPSYGGGDGDGAGAEGEVQGEESKTTTLAVRKDSPETAKRNIEATSESED